MSAADDIKEAFQGRRGKILVALGVGVLGYIWWTRGRSGAAPDTGVDITDGYGSERNPPDAGPSVGNDVQDKTGGRPGTNSDWLAAAVERLSESRWSAPTVQVALSRALGGDSLTTAQMAIVEEAIRTLGYPPEGMPPLTAAPPTGGGGTTTPPPKTTPKAPSGYWFTIPVGIVPANQNGTSAVMYAVLRRHGLPATADAARKVFYHPKNAAVVVKHAGNWAKMKMKENIYIP